MVRSECLPPFAKNREKWGAPVLFRSTLKDKPALCFRSMTWPPPFSSLELVPLSTLVYVGFRESHVCLGVHRWLGARRRGSRTNYVLEIEAEGRAEGYSD